MTFLDRRDAGRRLAELLKPLGELRPIVLALPRGGVPVAVEIAAALDAPLDVLAVRKIGAPGNPEFAIGAIAEDGTAVLDRATIRHLDIGAAAIDRVLAREARELDRRDRLFRAGRPPLHLHGRPVIVVDDGLATGLTDLAAVRAVRARGAGRVIVAAPVASREAVALLSEEADEVVCASVPDRFLGVGRWYEDFDQVSDDEVLALLARARPPAPAEEGPAGVVVTPLLLDAHGARLRGDLTVPADPLGLVVFAHGSGSSRLSPRNRWVASRLVEAGLATLLIDLLEPGEEGRREFVFDIRLLAERLEELTRRVREEPGVAGLPVGYFGASTGAGAALCAAAALGGEVRAVVSRGGRPDLAGDDLPRVSAPTLLIVGSRDPEVLRINAAAAERLTCLHRVEVVEGAGHLFEEPGTLEVVAGLARDWFRERLPLDGEALPGTAGTVSWPSR